MSDKLGKKGETHRGFPMVEFRDAYRAECVVQCSSSIGDYKDSLKRPGTSFVWLGIDKVKPLILASKASRYGIETDEKTGWVEFPVPEEVSLSARMHLDREQVAGLIERLQAWLDTGEF